MLVAALCSLHGTTARAQDGVTDTGDDAAATEGIVIDETNFPDPVFRAYVARWDEYGDGILLPEEISNVNMITFRGGKNASR